MFRPTVSVFNHKNQTEILSEVRLPSVFNTPIRNDIVQFVHYNLAKNARQAHGVDPKAGMKHSAESWGTGRAVARVPRVSGSGTHRTGQGAFGNMCRKGRLAFPLKTWRRWHRKVNLRQRRHALASAIAATAVPSLVLARGHRILQVPQFPLVLDDLAGQIAKTKDAVAVLQRFGAYEDVERCIKARTLRAGNGKQRNRRYKLRRGPLVVVNDESTNFIRALRNIPGVSTLHVKRLNISHLAPGGQVGRFVIYTRSAFVELEKQFGSAKAPGSGRKHYLLHRTVVSTSDISGLINSDAIQKVLRAKKTVKVLHLKQKKNPLKNKSLMKKLNPYAPILKELKKTEAAKKVKKVRKERKAHTKRQGQLLDQIEKQVLNKQDALLVEYKTLFDKTNL